MKKISLVVCLLNIAMTKYGFCQSDSLRNSLPEFDYNKSVFNLKDEQLTNVQRNLHFSVLTGYREGLSRVNTKQGFSTTVDTLQGTYRVYMINLPIIELISFGLAKPSRTILEVENPSRYFYNDTTKSWLNWIRENTYCFEYLMPIGTYQNTKMIESELASYFGVQFGYEVKLVDVFCLIRTSNKDKIKSKNKIENTSLDKFKNIVINELIDKVEKNIGVPVIDKTGYSGTIDINMHLTNDKDIESIRRQLKKYDLDLKQERCEMEMFMIRENRLKKGI